MTYMVTSIIFTFYFYTILYIVAFILDTSKKRIRIKWGVEVIGWLNLCFFYIYVLCYFFLFTTCTLIVFFFFRIVRIYVLSLLFLVYSVYMNHFFFFHIVRIYVLSLLFLVYSVCISIIFFFPIVRIYILSLFCLQHAHQSFFSSISYCKNLYTFF